MRARIVTGRDAVVRELRAAAPLMAALAAPVTARAPWLTAVLDARTPGPFGPRPAAVVVGTDPREPPAAAAFLSLRRRALHTSVTVARRRHPAGPRRPASGATAGP